jgi:hypothetical protein
MITGGDFFLEQSTDLTDGSTSGGVQAGGVGVMAAGGGLIDTPLQNPAPSFTNETGTAQSVPLVDQGAAALNGITQTRVNNFLATNIKPATPAAASPSSATEQQNDQKQSNPVVWIGLALLVAGVIWAMRR